MAMQNLKNMPEDKKRMIRNILTISGVVFAALGATSLIMPRELGEMMGQEDNVGVANMLGTFFILVGISDIAIAQIIFKGNTKND